MVNLSCHLLRAFKEDDIGCLTRFPPLHLDLSGSPRSGMTVSVILREEIILLGWNPRHHLARLLKHKWFGLQKRFTVGSFESILVLDVSLCLPVGIERVTSPKSGRHVLISWNSTVQFLLRMIVGYSLQRRHGTCIQCVTILLMVVHTGLHFNISVMVLVVRVGLRGSHAALGDIQMESKVTCSWIVEGFLWSGQMNIAAVSEFQKGKIVVGSKFP